MEQWPLLVADFASEYGIRLRREFHTMGWAEFTDHVSGLFSADTRLARHFKSSPEEEPDTSTARLKASLEDHSI